MPVTFGYVTGRIVKIQGDGADGDRLPDVVGATNVKPTFTPDRASFVSSELQAIVDLEPIVCSIREDGVLLDPQAAEGVWLVTGKYAVTLTGTKHKHINIVVTEDHTEENPYPLHEAVDYTPPPGTTTQIVVVPTGAAEGQSLVWRSGKLTWETTEGGSGGGAPITLETLPAGLTVAVRYDDGWPSRPTNRSDLFVQWYGGTTQPAGMLDGDIWLSGSAEPIDVTTPPTITTTTLGTLVTGEFRSISLVATGDVPITWDITNGSLPAGMTLDPAGVVAGTPTVAGSYSVTIRATNTAGSDAVNFSGTIVEPSLANHGTIYGSTTFPYPITGHTDGPASEGMAFYTTRSGGIDVLGGRVWLPEGLAATFYSTPIEMGALTRDHPYNDLISVAEVNTVVFEKVIASPAPGWNDLLFDTPKHINPFSAGTNNAIWIVMRYQSSPNYVGGFNLDPVRTDSVASPDATDVHLAEPLFPSVINSMGGASTMGNLIYPIDIIFQV